MNCENYLNLFDDLIEDDLDESSARQVILHVSACGECTAHFARLKQERELYEQYFEIETSRGLWAELQPKLAAVQTNRTLKSAGLFTGIFDWKSDVFAILKLTPALACLTVILMFGSGFGLLNFLFDDEASKTASVTKDESSVNRNAIIIPVETIEDEPQTSAQNPEIIEDDSLHSNQTFSPGSSLNQRIMLAAKDKKTVSQKGVPEKKFVLAREENAVAKSARPNEKEQGHRSQVESLEKEAKGDFYSLPFAGVLGESNENLQIIRVELPRASLLALGVDLQAENIGASVKTDLLIGSDGMARAIRLLK